MRKAVVELSIVPLGTGTPSVSGYVADVIKVLKKSGLKYELTAMGTIVEGDLNKIMRVIARMHSSVFSKYVKRVITTIKIDERRDKNLTIKGKIKSVKDKL